MAISKVNEEYKQVPQEEQSRGLKNNARYGYGYRHIQSILLFLCISVLFINTTHLSVTIVAMTNITTNHQNNTVFNASGENIVDIIVNESEVISYELDYDDQWDANKKYNWAKSIHEIIFLSSMISSGLMLAPMGLIIQRWGGKKPLQVALLTDALVSTPTPWLILWGGWKMLLVCRVIQGAAQAACYPASIVLLSNWMPVSERSRLSSYVYSGTSVGVVLAYQMSGLLANSIYGWPSTYWVIGFITFATFVLFTKFVAETPDDHKMISDEERTFITHSEIREQKKRKKAPWKAILTSRHSWAIILSSIGLLDYYTYVHYVLGADIRNSSVLSSLPHIGKIVTSFVFGGLSDFLINRKYLSIKSTRNISNSMSLFGMATSLIAVSFTKSVPLSIGCFIIALSLHSASVSGWMINSVDIAPHYSGSIIALAKAFAHIGIISLHILIASIVNDVTNQYQWRIIFISVASLAVISNSIFICFMSAETQLWNYGDREIANRGVLVGEECKDEHE